MSRAAETVSPAPVRPGDFPAAGHDHARCVDDALSKAEAICQDRGVRLTDIRRRVLEAVWLSHRPVGAYDILDSLQGHGKKAQPPTAYRALEFLLEQGLIHRIERLNAYIGCVAPDTPHDGQFLICRDCGAAAELLDRQIDKAIRKSAAVLGFDIEHPTVELEGMCAQCRHARDQASDRHDHG